MSIENIIAANAAATAPLTASEPALAPVDAPGAAINSAATQHGATVAPLQPATATGITLTPEQWAAYSSTQSRLAELEELERRRAADAQAAEIKALQAKGQIEQAFNLQREQARLELEAERKKLREVEDRAKRYALDGELARTLAEKPLVPGGAEQLTQLWRGQFSVEAQGDTFAVRAPDFQPVGPWIAAQLGRPEYAHFLRPQNPGGGTVSGPMAQGGPTPPAQPPAAEQPRNLGEAIAMQMANIAKQTATNATRSGGSTLNEDGAITRLPAAGFGLRSTPR
jgi:hypothetical protein